MPRVKEPVDLLLAKGKTHLTKADIEKRREQELKVPFTNIKAPKHLDKAQKAKFNDIADKLLKLGVMTELDVDCLAMFVMAQSLYLRYTKLLYEANAAGDLEQARTIQNLQHKVFTQCQTCGRELGLSITSRCKIVRPDGSEEEEEL